MEIISAPNADICARHFLSPAHELFTASLAVLAGWQNKQLEYLDSVFVAGVRTKQNTQFPLYGFLHW